MTILPLDTQDPSLETVGGKALNLSRLVRAGLSVPEGFVVPTQAYRAFVADNNLKPLISDSLKITDNAAPEELERASDRIRKGFEAGELAAWLRQELLESYRALDRTRVAVRSSATAEDLPGLSFAGQQNTYLNVAGEEELLQAVIGCWSSLWTARAIGYRFRNDVQQDAVALAVIVQEMISSDAAGVLFTANPLTGRRDEMVIDAAFGLGEGLVEGKMEPDHYTVREGADGPVIEKSLGAKSIAVRPDPDGGTFTEAIRARGRQALPDSAIVELFDLGKQVAEDFDPPQDVEWAWAEGRLVLLQSRPITSLYPLPDRLPRSPLRVLMSFGALQGMLDPMTPLGREVIHGLTVELQKKMGYSFDQGEQLLMYEAGDRLFINITGPVRNRLGRRVLKSFLSIAEPEIGQALDEIWDEDELAARSGLLPVSWPTLSRLAPFFAPIFFRVIQALRHPERSRQDLQRQLRERATELHARRAEVDTWPDRMDFLEDVFVTFPELGPELLARVVAGIMSLSLLRRLAGERGLLVTRGLPHNITTEMDLQLWEVANAIRQDTSAAEHFNETDAETLADEYFTGQLPNSVEQAIAAFLERYGMRGAAEIDIGRSRWREDPMTVMQVLRSYLQIDDPDRTPDSVFAGMAEAAEAGIEQLVQSARRRKGGRLRARLVRWLAGRVRALAGLRETPKFFIVRLLGWGREILLEGADELVAEGQLDAQGDVFFLRLEELRKLGTGAKMTRWQHLVSERRRTYSHEKRRQQVPRLLLTDGRAIYATASEGEAGEEVILGSPVSPGSAVGQVRVVLDPHDAELEPGEILVCPGTDPGWTPLFLAAGGLVMEVGGLMTHGSVVAREYGIPAVVGVRNATRRLLTGARVRIDGSSGEIRILEAADELHHPARE